METQETVTLFEINQWVAKLQENSKTAQWKDHNFLKSQAKKNRVTLEDATSSDQ